MKMSLNWINDYVDLGDVDVDYLINKLTITTAEIEGVERINEDVIIEIDNKSLTNRPDLWCHYGMAREIAAITRKKLKDIDYVNEEELKSKELNKLKVKIEEKDKCLRYSGIKIGNIIQGRSPEIITTRLENCGIRPINIIVDIANYVMMDIGQPMHTFDAGTIDTVNVYSIKQPVKLKTLDDQKREVRKDTLMIYGDDKPIAIAGIIGGEGSAVSENTKDVVLESATYDGVAVRKTATALGIRTDASARYEKFLDTSLTPIAIGRYLKLLKEYQPQVTLETSLYDNCIKETKALIIDIQHKYIETYLGNNIEKSVVIDILTSLQFEVQEADGLYKVKVPTFRATKDITCKADIIEEILRVYGYSNIKAAPNKMVSSVSVKNSVRDMEYLIKDILVRKFSFSEVQTYSWYDNKWLKKLGYTYSNTLKMANSTIKQFDKLRSDLCPNIIKIIYENRKSYEQIKIFEIGRIFILDGENLNQSRHMTAAFYSDECEESSYRYTKGISSYLIKVIKNVEPNYIPEFNEYKQNCLCISYADINLGYIYSVSNAALKAFDGNHSINVLDIDLEALNSIKKKEIKYKAIPKFPGTYLDFSILTSTSMPYADIDKNIKNFNHKLVTRIEYIDTYLGDNIPENMKSTTVRLEVLNPDRTLKLEEVNNVKESFVKHLNANRLMLR
ncbi:phenylalanine--tRNA ligase subunit beta [Clostridium oryzae]|uniref:Phenylalanine--tRNA ligase beta subunit n=1 Tax=Clostridium oryzae TaxID=1450648 RepID=A0A1V4ISU3_9CLOT|nr:phenylalanine--tRNA ligase subunit beta [Clostridium oryzae]OPJ62890.1 phenylalanine--tRNA ligase beta subunit [Clostridium oryzae]